MAPILQAFPNATKVFVTFNDLTDYECLIDQPTGNHYAELSYLIKKIQFNRIYSIQEYFNYEPVELEQKIELVSLIQPEFKPLLFTYDMLQNLYRSAFSIGQVKENNFVRAFSQKNILHIYGHGENKQLDFGQWQYSIPFYQKNKWQNLRHDKKQYSNCQSLVIFNTCFSGTSGFIYEYDSDLHTNILLNGAPAIIVSTVRSEDKASSIIFSKFYQYLEEGYDFENALYQAKKKYLENQEGEQCNPYRWQGFKSITRQKIKAFEPQSWWEELFKWFSNLQYLFGLPALN
jgi:CHAT domain-containing protein